MKRCHIFIWVLLTIFSSGLYASSLYKTSPDQVGMSSKRLDKIDKVVEGIIERNELSGAVTLITRRGKLVHFKSYGYRDLETKSPMEKDSLFRLFSMTKPVTCAAVLLLVENGNILLNEPISKYLPEFKDMKVLVEEKDGEIVTEPAKSEITIQQLAMHTSGLGYGIPADISPTLARQYQDADVFNPRNPLKDAIGNIASLPLRHQPGTTWKYGTSIDVLARLVEVVSDQSYGDFLQQRIFKPLGMHDTGFVVPDAGWDRVARLYTRSRDEEPLSRNLDYEDYYKIGIHHGGGSGLISSPMDYARFAQMLANGGELDGVRILSPQSVKRMSTNLIREERNNTPWHNDRAQGFGLGVSVVKDPAYLETLSSIGTWGWSGYASTMFFIDPEEDIMAIFMAQYIPTNTKQWWQRYTNLVYQAIIN
jgi:CubicO group peptidase (beta-lactamase class C family)